MSRPCPSGKVSYPSRGKAMASIRVIKKRGARSETGKKPGMTYLCKQCQQWHLSSRPS